MLLRWSLDFDVGKRCFNCEQINERKHLYCRSCFDAKSSNLTPGFLGERNSETMFE